jgi:hypothetical protein
MDIQDIMRMAKKAEAWSLVDHDGIAALERFASLVAAAEREECAKVCDGWLHADGDACAAAIRARG